MTPRALVVFAFLVFIAGSAPVCAQTNSADVQLLAQRLAGGLASQVTFGALPPNWTPPVPLPSDVPILGSVSGSNRGGFVSIYYQPVDARQAFDSYVAQLKAAGFTQTYQMSASPSGFVASPPTAAAIGTNFVNLCRAGQTLFVRLNPQTNDDLRLDVLPKNTAQCGQPAPVFNRYTPLPALVPPAGAIVVPVGGGTISVGLTERTESVTSAALISGTIGLSTLFDSFLTQLANNNWTIASRLAGRDEAVAMLRFNHDGQQWQAWFSILKGVKPQTYSAHIDAINMGLPGYRGSVAAQMGATGPRTSLSWLPTTIRKTDDPLVLQLIRQLMSFNGYRPAQLYLRQIPPGFPVRVPLPQATPLAGSIQQFQATIQGQRQYNLYYRLNRSELQTYVDRLQARGWKVQPASLYTPNGFLYAYYPVSQTYCSKNMPSVNISGTTGSSAVVVSVLGIRNAFSCDTMQNLLPGQGFNNPLPRLDAPTGATMLTANAGVRAGNSGAVLITTQPIGELLDAFTAKFTQKGWALAASTTTADLGSRSYTFLDTQAGGQKWQAVLTLYRSYANAGTYYAFLDLTKLPVK